MSVQIRIEGDHADWPAPCREVCQGAGLAASWDRLTDQESHTAYPGDGYFHTKVDHVWNPVGDAWW